MKSKSQDFKVNLILVLIMFVHLSVKSQETILLGSEIRPRTEFRNGYNKLFSENDEYAFHTSQRSRLFFEMKKDKWTVKLNAQDIRVWGAVPLQVESDSKMSMYEAWAKYNFSTKWSLLIGRQEISFDDERFLGSANWNQQGRVHDGISMIFNDSLNKFHGFVGFNQNGIQLSGTNYTVPNNYKAIQVLWYNRKFFNNELSLLGTNVGWQSPHSSTALRNMQTVGNHLILNPFSKLQMVQRFYYQFGKNSSFQDVSAYFVGLDIHYKISDNFKLMAGIETLSGNSELKTSSVNRAFNPLYGTNHRFNGIIDYFYVGNHQNSVGLIDGNFGVQFSKSNHNLLLKTHLFSAVADVANNDIVQQKANPYLGTELDLVYRYRISKEALLELGYAQMFANKSMEYLKGGNHKLTQNWAYVMLTVNPSFLIK